MDNVIQFRIRLVGKVTVPVWRCSCSIKSPVFGGETVELHKALPDMKTMKVNFNSSSLHIGKILIVASSVNYSYGENPLWSSPLEFTIKSGDRIHLKGSNGSGKTTLLRLITGSLAPTQGSLIQAEGLTYVYLDQEYSTIRNDLSVLEQLALFNSELYDNELRTILNRFFVSCFHMEQEM